MNLVKKKDVACISKELWTGLFSICKEDTNSLKLLVYVIGKLNPLDLSVSPEPLTSIKFSLNEVYDYFGLYGAHKLAIIKRAVKQVVDNSIEIETANGWYPTPFFDFNDTFIDYRNGFLHISIPKGFLPFLSNLLQYVRIRLAMGSLSHRAFVFYCRVMEQHSSKVISMDLNKLLASCGVHYSTYGLFKQKFLTPVIQELNKAGVGINYTENKTHTGKVMSLNFTIDESVLIETIESQAPEAKLLIEDKPKEKDNLQPLEIFNHYIATFSKDHRYKPTPERLNIIKARLNEGYTLDECKAAIDFIKTSPFHMGDNKDKKVYIDLVDIVFNKTKFPKIIDNLKAKPRTLTKEEKEEAFRKEFEEKLREAERRSQHEQVAI